MSEIIAIIQENIELLLICNLKYDLPKKIAIVVHN